MNTLQNLANFFKQQTGQSNILPNIHYEGGPMYKQGGIERKQGEMQNTNENQHRWSSKK